VYGAVSNIVAPKTKGQGGGTGTGGNHGFGLGGGITHSLHGGNTGTNDSLDNLFGNNPIV
jgi:hypothetical protein